MADTALHDLTLAEAAALIRSRTLSPVEYTPALLARTHSLEATRHKARGWEQPSVRTASIKVEERRRRLEQVSSGLK